MDEARGVRTEIERNKVGGNVWFCVQGRRPGLHALLSSMAAAMRKADRSNVSVSSSRFGA